VYRQILTIDPAHADALHLLGLTARQAGRNDMAIDYLRRAIGLHGIRSDGYGNLGVALRDLHLVRPDLCDAHTTLGDTLYALGRPAEAEASYREVVRLRPTAEAHNNLGAAQQALGRPAEAEASFREALRLQPDYPEIHNNLGNALQALGRAGEAETSYREALRLRPNYPDAHNNLGTMLYARRPAEAETSYREALRLRPDYPEAHNNLGNVLYALERPSEAAASYREALRLRPDYPEAHNNLGNALQALGRAAEAESKFREALRLRPSFPEIHNNLASALCALGRPVEAEVSFREALRLRSEYAEAHNNLGYALLLAGRFEEGWKECEWRLKTKQISTGARDYTVPQWGGEAIGDRIILLHAEQGLGDTLQFCRYVPLMPPCGGIILEVQAPLVGLLSRLPGITQIVASGDRLPPLDLHCSLLSLPYVFGTTLDTIPATTPYLSADPDVAAKWQDRLTGLDGLRVGLVWAGGQKLSVDRRRSIALNSLSPLGEISGVSFISLQKDEPAAQAANPPPGMRLHDFTADLHDFEDTAALVANLDLVISVDTSVAHLAGALGKPVWLLNRFDTDWRWLLNRNDSPWYSTLRQFRQPSSGDWNSVIGAMREALQHLAADDCIQGRSPSTSTEAVAR
jgi:Flp pilus assembly protein TadD